MLKQIPSTTIFSSVTIYFLFNLIHIVFVAFSSDVLVDSKMSYGRIAWNCILFVYNWQAVPQPRLFFSGILREKWSLLWISLYASVSRGKACRGHRHRCHKRSAAPNTHTWCSQRRVYRTASSPRWWSYRTCALISLSLFLNTMRKENNSNSYRVTSIKTLERSPFSFLFHRLSILAVDRLLSSLSALLYVNSLSFAMSIEHLIFQHSYAMNPIQKNCKRSVITAQTKQSTFGCGRNGEICTENYKKLY